MKRRKDVPYTDDPSHPCNFNETKICTKCGGCTGIYSPFDWESLNDDYPVEFLMGDPELSSLDAVLVESKKLSKLQSPPVRAFGRVVFKVKEDINGFIQFANKLICKHKGHDWETYAYSTGYYSYDVEQAGHCRRCHFDTHS